MHTCFYNMIKPELLCFVVLLRLQGILVSQPNDASVAEKNCRAVLASQNNSYKESERLLSVIKRFQGAIGTYRRLISNTSELAESTVFNTTLTFNNRNNDVQNAFEKVTYRQKLNGQILQLLELVERLPESTSHAEVKQVLTTELSVLNNFTVENCDVLRTSGCDTPFERLQKEIGELLLLVDRRTYNLFINLFRQYRANLMLVYKSDPWSFSKTLNASMIDRELNADSICAIMDSAEKTLPLNQRLHFFRVTGLFVHDLVTAVAINTPARLLSARIRIVTHLLTELMAIFPDYSVRMHQGVQTEARKFNNMLTRIIHKLEKTDYETLDNLKKLALQLDHEFDTQVFISVVQGTTLEMLKRLHDRPDEIFLDIASDYLSALQSHKIAAKELCRDADFDIGSMYGFALINMFDKYFSIERAHIILQNIEKMIYWLEKDTPSRFHETIHRIKKDIQDRTETHNGFTTLFESVSVNFAKFAFILFYTYNGTLPMYILNADLHYTHAVEEIVTDAQVNQMLQTIQTPAELILDIENVADQIVKTIMLTATDFRISRIEQLNRSFRNVLNLTIFQLQKLSCTSNYCKSAYSQLQKMHEHLASLSINLEEAISKFVTRVENFVRLMKRLLDTCYASDEDYEVIEIYSGILFGMRHIYDATDFYLKMATQHLSQETYVVHIKTLANRITYLLQRLNTKPELKKYMMHNLYYFSLYIVESVGSYKIYPTIYKEVYSRIHLDVKYLQENAMNMTVDEVSSIFGVIFQNYASLLARLLEVGQPQIREADEEYRYSQHAYSFFCSRYQSNFNGYYNSLSVEELIFHVKNVSGSIIETLRNRIQNSNVLKIQVLKLSNRLCKVTKQLTLKSKVHQTNNMLKTAQALQTLGQSRNYSADDVNQELAMLIRQVTKDLDEVVDAGARVDFKSAIVEYLVTLEDMHIDLQNVQRIESGAAAFEHILNDIDVYAAELTRALRRTLSVVPDLDSYYHDVMNATTSVADKIPLSALHGSELQKALYDITRNKENIHTHDMGVHVQRVVGIFRKFVLITPEHYEYVPNLQHDRKHLVSDEYEFISILKPAVLKVLLAIQEMHIFLESKLEDTKCRKSELWKPF